MSPELDKKLCEKYPLMFKNRDVEPNESCMCWGFECGDGWYNILDNLCEALTYTYTTSTEISKEDALAINNSGVSIFKETYYFKVKPPQVVVDQVKEKFGTLRFYFHTELSKEAVQLLDTKRYLDLEAVYKRYQNFFDGIVHMAEVLSSNTCEYTGKPGELHTTPSRWYKTLNKEFAQTDEHCKLRNYVPVSSLPKNQ